MSGKESIRICLIVEGAYPYIMGGVSIWLHKLITYLPQHQFVLWTIVPERGQPHKFELPENVVELREISLADKLKSGRRRLRANRQWQVVREFHQQMHNRRYEQFEQFYQQLSPNNPSALAVENIFKDFQSWQILMEEYKINHPISPFINYYWAWRAIHIPLLQMMQAPVPEADVYHAVSTGYAGLLGAIAKIRTGRPFLLTEHGIYAKERELEINQSELFHGYQRKMWKKNYHGLARLAYHHADLIIALFRKNQHVQIQAGAPPEKCRVIPNGIEIDEFASLKAKPHAHFNVGFIGRLVAIKDVKTFIMAARIVADKIPSARFYLIGPQDEQESYFEELKILIENLRLGDAFIFTGRVDVKDYLPLLDVLCLTSIKEAQPLSIIEAMVAGVPVVATDVGDVSDLLEQNGIVVPPKSPDKLAEGIIRFATDEAFRRTCSERARRSAIRRYDIRALIREYDELYRYFGMEAMEKWQA